MVDGHMEFSHPKLLLFAEMFERMHCPAVVKFDPDVCSLEFSCYDAQVCYDCHTDIFTARYS